VFNFNFFSNKHKSIPDEGLDEFDKRFGFMLKYSLDDIDSYNMVKEYFYSNQK